MTQDLISNPNNKSKIKIIISLIILIVLISSIWFLYYKNKNSPISPPSNNTQTENTSDKIYTMADVSQHSNSTNCWAVVNGGVYNLTPYLYRHPGGYNYILSMCGKDGSSNFTAQHGGQKRPESELSKLKIGNLSS